uniref:Hexamethylene bis-acetamide-inducible protein n=1 Tax=Amblyomma triste TaxID=251400 RepID=A0A023GBQ8_AMBTT
MIASIASAPSLSANGSADTSMTLDKDMTVAAEPAGSEALVLPSGKHRKRRRGKKRRQGRDDPDAGLSSSDAASPAKGSPTKRRKKQVMIRPSEVPKAPANFTQFIIDDHENCALYQSFEAAYPNGHSDVDGTDCRPADLRLQSTTPLGVSQTDESGEEEPQSWFPAGDHYESLDYGNMMKFYEKDFEAVYSSARIDELMRLPRSEVADMFTALERRAAELYDELHKLDPQNCLDELQRQLLRLQDENQALLKLNLTLRSAATSSLTTSSSSSGHDADDSDHCDDQRDEESDNESDDSGHEEDSGDDGGVVKGVGEDCSRP